MDYLSLAYVLLALSLVLTLTEMFIPTGGICFLLAGVSAIAGIGLIFMYGDPTVGFITMLAIFVVLPITLSTIVYLWPGLLWGKRLIPRPEDDVTVAEMPGNAQLDKLKGRIGKTVSPLRPAGVVEFDGKRIDCLSEGMMIDSDQWVRCIDVKAGHVFVRVIDKPKLQDLENIPFG